MGALGAAGGRMTGAGAFVGVAGGIAAGHLMASILYDVGPSDPMTFTAVPLILSAVALTACAVPAWRAARVDPLSALEAE